MYVHSDFSNIHCKVKFDMKKSINPISLQLLLAQMKIPLTYRLMYVYTNHVLNYGTKCFKFFF